MDLLEVVPPSAIASGVFCGYIALTAWHNGCCGEYGRGNFWPLSLLAPPAIDVRQNPAEVLIQTIIGQLVATRHTPLARAISEALQNTSGPIIRPLYSLTEEEFQCYLYCRHCDVDRTQYLTQVCGLFLSPNRIFVNTAPDVSYEQIRETLIHETVHYINFLNCPEMPLVEDEFLAYRAEHEYDGNCYLTRRFDKTLRARVEEICANTNCAHKHNGPFNRVF